MREGTTGLRAFMRRIMLAALIVLAAASARAAELDFPTLTGHVVDEAGILDQATRSTLTTRLADLETPHHRSGRWWSRCARCTASPSRSMAVALGRHWHIGQAGKNNGVLLIVAPHERKVRIEVGYGLEGKLTDAATKLIIENTITPRFRASDYPGGIRGGADHIIELLTYRPGEMLPSRDLGWYGKSAADDRRDWFADLASRAAMGLIYLLLSIPVVIFVFFFLYLPISFAVKFAIWMGWLPKRPRRGQPQRAASSPSRSSSSDSWSSSSASSSSSSSSDSSYSGGGGDFGGGGSSGSW